MFRTQRQTFTAWWRSPRDDLAGNGCERNNSTSSSRAQCKDISAADMMEEVLAMLQQLELANTALQTELREAHEVGEE